ncbi:MAG: hypothetical protein AAF399_18655 [Bacteroidota bacterium]
MKDNRRSFFFLWVVLLPFVGLQAQADFRQGYVVTLEGDTLKGWIDNQNPLEMRRMIQFRAEEGREIRSFTPETALEARVYDRRYHVRKKVDGQLYFLEYLFRGNMTVYRLLSSEGFTYYLEKPGVPLTLIPFEEKEIYGDNGVKYNKITTKHIGVLTYYTQDAPELRPKINGLAACRTEPWGCDVMIA